MRQVVDVVWFFVKPVAIVAAWIIVSALGPLIVVVGLLFVGLGLAAIAIYRVGGQIIERLREPEFWQDCWDSIEIQVTGKIPKRLQRPPQG